MLKKLFVILSIILLLVILGSCDINLGNKDNQKNPKEKDNVESFERFFDDSISKKITIEITANEWNQLDNHMVDYYQRFDNYRTDQYAKADMVYQDSNGTVVVSNIGFRTRGNTSRGRIQNQDGSLNIRNFKISFKETFDMDTLKSLSNRTVFELEEIDLKHSKNDQEPYYDPTYLTEKFSLDLMKSFGVPAAHTTLVEFYIKIGPTTHFYGLYTAFEPIDQMFLQRRLDTDAASGNLYKALWQQYGPASLQVITNPKAVGIKDTSINYRPAYDIKTNRKSNTGSDLKSWVRDLNAKNGHDFKIFIEETFEVDLFLRLLAINVLLGNPDDYRAMGNNYYLYKNPKTNKWMMIPYDYDHGLGQGWRGEPVFNQWTIGFDIYTWGNLNKVFLNQSSHPHPLSDKILLVPEYQLRYESYLKELINPSNDYFNFSTFHLIYQQQKSLYDHKLHMAMNNMRFDLRNVSWYMNQKIVDIENQLLYYQNQPTKRPS
jgi:spore coat protein H